jgi:hypothetical protein
MNHVISDPMVVDKTLISADPDEPVIKITCGFCGFFFRFLLVLLALAVLFHCIMTNCVDDATNQWYMGDVDKHTEWESYAFKRLALYASYYHTNPSNYDDVMLVKRLDEVITLQQIHIVQCRTILHAHAYQYDGH